MEPIALYMEKWVIREGVSIDRMKKGISNYLKQYHDSLEQNSLLLRFWIRRIDVLFPFSI